MTDHNQAVTIVAAKPAHYPAILQLNQQLVQYLSPLDEVALKALADQAELFLAAVAQSQLVGFMIALREDQDYQSVNYRWFKARYQTFFYIDRVVIQPNWQGRAIGRRIYQRLFAEASKQGVSTICAEINSRPVNRPSLSFHDKLGFREVGRQTIADGKKQVSMQVKEIG